MFLAGSSANEWSLSVSSLYSPVEILEVQVMVELWNKTKQAGAELFQAEDKLGLAKPSLPSKELS